MNDTDDAPLWLHFDDTYVRFSDIVRVEYSGTDAESFDVWFSWDPQVSYTISLLNKNGPFVLHSLGLYGRQTSEIEATRNEPPESGASPS